MATAGFSRRQVLTLAGLTLGVGVVELGVAPTSASAAPADQPPTLEPIGDQPLTVLAGTGQAPGVCPRQLAVTVNRGGRTLPAGTKLSIAFDPRLYAPVTPAIVTLDGQPVPTTNTITTDPTTGSHTSTVTLRQAVPAAGRLAMVAGVAHPLPYPRDLVRNPPDATADLAPAGGASPVRRSLTPDRPSSHARPVNPWGIELAAAWAARSWGEHDRYRYYYPVQVTLRSVGPGKVPAPVSFAVTVDPRVVETVTVAAVSRNREHSREQVRLVKTVRDGAVYRTSWRLHRRLGAADVVDVRLRVGTRVPTGALPTIKHPVVGLIDMGADIAQRPTGRTSLTRIDAVWS